MGLPLQQVDEETNEVIEVIPQNILILQNKPSATPRKGTSTKTFQARKVADYALRDAKNRELGRLGELLVIEYEKQLLASCGKAGLITQIEHVSETIGDGLGYDIHSITPDGQIKYIEVKTTDSKADTQFLISSNEIEFARQYVGQYALYRVYEYNQQLNTGKLYIIEDIDQHFNLNPTQYRAILKND